MSQVDPKVTAALASSSVPFNPSLNSPGLRGSLSQQRARKAAPGCTNLCFRVSGLSRCWCSCSRCFAQTVLRGKWVGWNVCPDDPDGRLNSHIRGAL